MRLIKEITVTAAASQILTFCKATNAKSCRADPVSFVEQEPCDKGQTEAYESIGNSLRLYVYTLYTLIILWHDTRSLPFATYGIFKLYSLGCDCHLVYLTIIRIRSNFMPKMSAKGIVTSDSRPKSLVKGGIRQGFSGIDFFGTRGVNLAE